MIREQTSKRKQINYCLLFVLCYLFIVLFSCEMPRSGLSESAHYDPDLNAWRTASWSPFTVNDSITDFTFANGLYIAVSSTGVIAWSDNGDIWHRAKINSNPNITVKGFNAVCFGNKMFAAAGDGGIFAWSPDGKEWDSGQMPGFDTNENINGIAYGANTFAAVGDNAKVCTSSNGYQWSGGKNASFYDIRLNDVAFDSVSGRFYAVGDFGNRGWTTTPSGAWNHKAPENPVGTSHITKVTIGRYGSGTGIGIVYDRKPAIATNADFSGFDADVDTFLFNGNAVNGIAWGGDFFVSAGTSAMIGYWPSGEPSRDVERYWRALTFPEFSRWEITALKACNGRFFAGSIGGKIGYSK